MSRTSKIFLGVAVAALCGLTSPATAVPGNAAAPVDPSGLGGMQKVSAAEVQAFEQRSPEKAARLKANSARSNGGAAIQGEYFRIVNAASDKCLAIGNGSQANSAHAIQWDCTGSDAQLWWVTADHIQNAASGKFLAIGESSKTKGAHAIQWENTGSQGQKWTRSGGFIWNDNSGLVLAIGESSTANGAHAIQWSYTGSNGQRWSQL
ncbi:RICIN domain-containing protein [Streptomyces sp. NPDC004111]|uniref:RICIN domain-containing protein n=1 Tax=Streptomyces sp. NPDC004111 TaxID=3364690 RepID=UPI0036B783C4